MPAAATRSRVPTRHHNAVSASSRIRSILRSAVGVGGPEGLGNPLLAAQPRTPDGRPQGETDVAQEHNEFWLTEEEALLVASQSNMPKAGRSLNDMPRAPQRRPKHDASEGRAKAPFARTGASTSRASASRL